MENKKIILIFQSAFIYVFIFLVVGGFMSWFLYQQIRSDEASLELAQNEYNNTLKQLESFDSVKKDFDNSVMLKDQISGMIVSSEGTLGLIEELENAAKLTGVALVTNIGDNPVKKSVPKIGQTKTGNLDNDKSQDVWLELYVEGSYANTIQFIRYLENAKKIVAVSAITINQSVSLTPEEIFNNPEGTIGTLKSKILISNVF